jgi:predicted DNA binding CopG/RHH family protein
LPIEKTKSEFLAPDIGGKGKRFMKGKIKYTDEPIGKVKIISDFLPSPEELALKDETVKVTIALSKASVEFFKNEAKKYNTQYQKMIRRLLDEYTAHQA